MWMSARRPASPAAPLARAPSPYRASLYRDWVETPAAAMERVGEAGFSLAEASELLAWGEAQRPWGLSLRLRRDLRGAARLAEIVGPDGCAPLALLYRSVDGTLRVDDFAGEVRVCAAVAAALEIVLECV